MKKLFLLLLILVFSSSFSTLSAQSWFWGREAKPSSSNGVGDPNNDHTTAADDHGNAYITGAFADTLSFGFDTIKNSFASLNFGVYLVKYDSNGNVRWARNSNGSGSGAGTSIAACKDGSVYVAGIFQDTIKFGIYTLTAGNTGVFLVKYDSSGNVIWARQSTSTTTTTNPSLATDEAGNAYIAGNYSGSITFGSLVLSTISLNGNLFLVKYDKNGNAIWAKQGTLANSSCSGAGYSVATDNKDYIYVTGSFTDTITFGITELKEPRPGNAIFIVKYDSAGNPIWARQSFTLSPLSSINAASISADGMGNSYVTGNFSDSVSFGPYNLHQANGDIFLVRYDLNGVARWAAQAHDLKHNNWNAYSISSDTTKQGGCFLALAGSGGASFKLKIQADTFNFNTIYDQACLLVHFDSSGKVLCGSIFDEGGEDDDDAVGVDRSGRYIYYGGDLQDTTIFGTDTLIYGGDMPFVARWKPCTPVMIIEGTDKLSPLYSTVLYPNPNKGKFTIQLANGYQQLANGQVEIYNMLGEEVYSHSFNTKHSTFPEGIHLDNIDLGTQSPGVYLYRIVTETGNLASEGKFIIQQ